MKKLHLHTLILAFIGPIFVFNPVLAMAQTTAPTSLGFTEDFWEKVLIAILAAICGFVANLLLAYLKRRSEPRKQISFDTITDSGLVAVEDNIKSKVRILYNENEVQDIYSTRCHVENTGNSVIKQQFVRFQFPSDSRVIENFIDPLPQPELGVEDSPLPELHPNEKRYLIKHFEVGQKVSFRFVVAGPHGDPKLHPYNEVGDVRFVSRSVAIAIDQVQQVRVFIRFYLLLMLMPPAFKIFPFELGDAAAATIYLALLVPLLRRLPAFVKASAQLITQLGSLGPTNSVVIGHNSRMRDVVIQTK